MHGHPNLLQYAISERQFLGYTQSGVHDSGILCRECDGLLGRYDNYAYTVLPEKVEATRVHHLGRGQAVVSLGRVDVKRFRLFLASLAWRAGISANPMFQLVTLGPYESRLKEALLGKTAHLDAIGAVVFLFRPPKYADGLWSPFCRKINGVNTAVFYLPPWRLEMRLDKREFAPPFSKFAIREAAESFAVVQNYWTDGEFKVLQDAQLAIQQASPGNRNR